MAYSDYGGYAYRNGKRVEARSDATISPEGDVFGSPGMWPGFAAYAAGGMDGYEKRRDWPSGHAVLGDGPIYVVTMVRCGDLLGDKTWGSKSIRFRLRCVLRLRRSSGRRIRAGWNPCP